MIDQRPDPDPLHVDEPDEVWDPAISEWIPRSSAAPALMAGVVYGVIIGIALGAGLFSCIAAPRSAASAIHAGDHQGSAAEREPSLPSEAPRSGSLIEAAADVGGVAPAPAGGVGASPDPSGEIQLDDEGGVSGTPPPPDTAVDLAHGRTGIIALATGHGPNYLAIPIGPGHLVEICGPGGCWTTVSTDAGPNHDMLVAGRIADVAVGHWEHICGLDRGRGLCRGSWRVVGDRPTVTPPATDVSP